MHSVSRSGSGLIPKHLSQRFIHHSGCRPSTLGTVDKLPLQPEWVSFGAISLPILGSPSCYVMLRDVASELPLSNSALVVTERLDVSRLAFLVAVVDEVSDWCDAIRKSWRYIVSHDQTLAPAHDPFQVQHHEAGLTDRFWT